jgi:hypothetical protein
MGYNSLLFINNACISDIDAHAYEWWQVAKRALGLVAIDGLEKIFAFRGSINHNIAVWCRPSDSIGLIAVGHNMCTHVASISGTSVEIDPHSDKGKLLLLKEAAKGIGYKLIKIQKEMEPECEDMSSPGPEPKPTRQKSSSTKTPSKAKKRPSKKDSKIDK